jgi:hypothetical protein
VDPFHERLARLGLAVGEPFGLALAGGYAIQAAGFLERPSEDVDMMVIDEWRYRLREPAQAIADAYEADGLTVEWDTEGAAFQRLVVTDRRSGERSKVELMAESRANPPIRMWIGPVLHPADAVDKKMGALFDRAEIRDFVDINAVLASGQFDTDDLYGMAYRSQAWFELSTLLMALDKLPMISDAQFVAYGMTARQIADMRVRFADWRAELLDQAR